MTRNPNLARRGGVLGTLLLSLLLTLSACGGAVEVAPPDTFPQRCLVGSIVEQRSTGMPYIPDDPRIYLNTNAPSRQRQVRQTLRQYLPHCTPCRMARSIGAHCRSKSRTASHRPRKPRQPSRLRRSPRRGRPSRSSSWTVVRK